MHRIETNSTLMSINVSLVSIFSIHVTLSYAARNSNGLSNEQSFHCFIDLSNDPYFKKQYLNQNQIHGKIDNKGRSLKLTTRNYC